MVEGFKHTEVGLIPSDWEVIKIHEVIDSFQNGYAFSSQGYKSNGIPIITMAQIGLDGTFQNDFTKVNFWDTEKAQSLKNFFVYDGDLIIAMTDVTPEKNLIGRMAIVKSNKPLLLNQRVGLLRLKKNKINNTFLRYYSNTSPWRQYCISVSTLGVQANIGTKDILNGFIPFPKLPEQTAIATALHDADALIQKLEQLIAKKRNIKTGAMQELLKPKEGWEVKKLGEVSDIIRGGSPRPIEAYLTNDVNGINWIKIGDVDKSAKYIYTTEEKIISKGAAYSRSVKEGDFLLSNSMSFGRPYILKTSGCVHDGWLVIQNYHATFVTDFLYYLLGFETTLNQYKNLAAGSTVLNLNKEIVAKVSVNYPSLQEQTRIAQILSDMDNEIQELEKQLEKYKMLKQGMMQSLLTGKIRLN